MAKKSMYQRPDGLYESIRTINGKRKAFRGRSIREVERKILEYKEEAKEGPCFERVAEDWWEDFLERCRNNSTKSTKPAMERAIKEFSGRRIFSITSQEIKDWILVLAKQGYAKKTVKNHLSVVSSIYRFAQEKYNKAYNPAALVMLPKNLPESKRKLPTDEEDASMMASVKDHPIGLFLFLAKYTGARRGELLALKYSDFNFDDMTITIERAVHYPSNRPEIGPPKTEAGIRKVPMLNIVAAVLPQGKPGHYLFSSDGGKTPLTNSKFEDLFDDYKETTGVTATPHQWRHLNATMMFEAGLQPKDAQTMIGHADIQTTMDIYTHVRDQQIHKARQKLNKFVEQETRKKTGT